MLSFAGVLVLLTIGIVTIVIATPTAFTTAKCQANDRGPDSCTPVVIAHRGASGYVPEHTLGSYALAITMGADYIEPDLVMTKDGQLISRHDNELGLTTNVASHTEFADRYRTQTVDSNEVSGWFTEDFTLAEIKTLRAIERIPDIRPGNARMDEAFQVLTFQEIIDLVKSLQISQRRTIGIYPEIKHSSHFKNLGLPMEQLVVNTFHRNGYLDSDAPVYIQSFEISNLKELKKMTNLRLLQLYDSKSLQPADQVLLGTGITYGNMSTPEGLAEVAKYASAVGPDKSYIIPRNADNSLGEPTNFVNDAHAVGLKVHPYTFRAENTFLPKEYQSDNPSKQARGNLTGELQKYIEAGIDGLFSDQPDIPLRMHRSCL
ncbi:glycerophosphodiester phosphodiesterase GDPD6-like isoform X2 [Maniola jurtina]|nr:glycerophosphodiester phosphodiesterase GDPD6-like isoform X2 [Maniola jurtina]XP_045760655.1 glycerophosphodiester phosphodiesterase GDPD6-like isoform X2 [Maniola jurtina]XP_045760656.1 glycerophosphodiester phosphodiesterase GDPD6-like isoform X2 [Maniola jurtina]XP_045760657.1 glycerophosphodiester phosphodiesterase GDPD6-like isoform X2 [Maniola jurtina]